MLSDIHLGRRRCNFVFSVG
uniref:Uncharacterized protein n=1 Tax=Anguilla anguilla TaxID=7936 RepID=A0A0E9SGI9_ANGAN